MSPRLADRLNAARRRQFVGRASEQALFRSTLRATDLPFYVLYIFGPGGIGKTTLLHEFIEICNQTQTPAFYVDGRDIEPFPESFLNALQLVMGPIASVSSFEFEFPVAQTQRCVLFIDTYEALAPLDPWLRQRFLPQLPDRVLTVLAGRDPLPLAWRADPGWQTLIRTLLLRNLSPDESLAYLTNHEIPAEQHQTILNFTYGHPLALSLVADMFAQRDHIQLQPQAAPDMIKTLLERLVQKVPGPAHRTALEACAIVRVTTEALLAEMLAMPDSGAASGQGAHELFEWLRELSFMESRRGGLFPHDLVRETLVADLRWRNPDWYTELHRRARAYYTVHLPQTSGQAQQRLLLDAAFLHRHNPLVRPFFEWQVSASTLTSLMQEADIPQLTEMVASHEGQDSARLAAHWFARQPDGVLVFRDSEGQAIGLLVMVGLAQASPEDLNTDPATQAVWSYLQQHAPLRPGENATLFRFWMARDTYQAVSPTQSLIFINIIRHYLTTPGLAFTFFPCADPDFWAPALAYVDLVRLPQADFEVGGWHYGIYGHDWRTTPPMAWLELLAEREIATEPHLVPSRQTAPAPVVLSQPDFEAAVRDALQDFARPNHLNDNPLLQSPLVIKRAGANAGEAERIAALQAQLKEAAASLQASPREMKAYRALYHTYFHPAPTQEQAAELLDIPFSTFRRHLKRGVTRVTEILWQQEIGGPHSEPKIGKK